MQARSSAHRNGGASSLMRGRPSWQSSSTAGGAFSSKIRCACASPAATGRRLRAGSTATGTRSPPPLSPTARRWQTHAARSPVWQCLARAQVNSLRRRRAAAAPQLFFAVARARRRRGCAERQPVPQHRASDRQTSRSCPSSECVCASRRESGPVAASTNCASISASRRGRSVSGDVWQAPWKPASLSPPVSCVRPRDEQEIRHVVDAREEYRRWSPLTNVGAHDRRHRLVPGSARARRWELRGTPCPEPRRVEAHAAAS